MIKLFPAKSIGFCKFQLGVLGKLSRHDADWNAARAERFAVSAKASGNAGTAQRAGTFWHQVVMTDVVPITHDDGVVAAWAIAGTALGVMHVAGINKM